MAESVPAMYIWDYSTPDWESTTIELILVSFVVHRLFLIEFDLNGPFRRATELIHPK